MKNLTFTILLVLLLSGITLAKTINIQKESKEFKFKKELKGLEVDYLTNKEFKSKVEKKQFWGIVEIIVNFVASWFSTSYGKYTEDTKNETGPYFIFDRDPNVLSLTEQLINKTIYKL